MNERIIKDTVRNRYVYTDGDDELGFLAYTPREAAISIDSTVVHPQHRGRGVAGRLVAFALDDLGESSTKRIEPRCSYVVDYIAKHPEYVELTRRG